MWGGFGPWLERIAGGWWRLCAAAHVRAACVLCVCADRFVPIEAPIVDPLSGESVSKSVFTIVFVGRQLQTRVNKICQYVGATVVQVPADELSYNLELQDIQRRIDDYTGVLERTKLDILKILQAIAYDDAQKFPVDSKMGKTYNTFGNDMLRVRSRLLCASASATADFLAHFS
jgi:hypothetical protein